MLRQDPGPDPRWVGNQRPNLPTALQKAADLLPKVTASHVFSFGYEGALPEMVSIFFVTNSPGARLGSAALAQVVFRISRALSTFLLFFRFVVLVAIHL
jgi:hypothetical protein